MQIKQIIGILAIIGAIMAIIGVFLAWVTFDYGLGTTSTSGWSLLTDGGSPDGAKEFMLKYASVFCIIAGVLTLVIFIVNFVDKIKINKYIPLISLILMILALIFCIGGFMAIGDYNGGTGLIKAGAGIYICIVGTILAIIAPIIALVKREDPAAAYQGAINDAMGKE